MGVRIGCGGVSLTCHMPDAPLQAPFRTTSPCFCTVMVLAVNLSVQPSSNICLMDISVPDWRWGNMWAVLALVDSNDLRLSYTLWVA